jgi:hypothetical protein
MFTRRVIMGIKADSVAEFARIVDSQILPQLHGQKGCRYEDSSITALLSEAVINSYWDTEEYAQVYDGSAYLDGLKALSDVSDGAPRVESFHISSSTFHLVTAQRRGAYRTSRMGKN